MLEVSTRETSVETEPRPTYEKPCLETRQTSQGSITVSESIQCSLMLADTYYTGTNWHLHSSPVVRALDLQLDGREFDSWPSCCRPTILGKLFTPTCLCRSQRSTGSMLGCCVRGCRQLCLSRQPLRCTALGIGCTPLLQCIGRLSLPTSMGQQNEYQLLGWVIYIFIWHEVSKYRYPHHSNKILTHTEPH